MMFNMQLVFSICKGTIPTGLGMLINVQIIKVIRLCTRCVGYNIKMNTFVLNYAIVINIPSVKTCISIETLYK